MGYTSTVKFAIRKDVYLKCLLLQNIPQCLQETDNSITITAHGEAMYWEIHGWKWYNRFPEIQEIHAWFDWLKDSEENPHKPVERGRDKDNKPIMGNFPAFGGIRIGEDNTDIQEWGYPSDFDLYVSVAIQTPY